MAECNIEESLKVNGVDYTGVNEGDAMSHLMMKHLVKHLKESEETGKEFIDSKF
jgi:hypothetical protein